MHDGILTCHLNCCVYGIKITFLYLSGLFFARVAIHPPGETKSDRLRVQSVALLQQKISGCAF